MSNHQVLDLFSAAAGGWSLGMHRAGFQTVAACEFIPWRRALYSQNNPHVRMYDDVRTLTGEQLLRDLGFLPGIVVGSPPCQDISSANTKGKGVEGERSGLYFEAIRIIGEIRDLGRERGESAARWIALENSANLRTRGADAVLAALEAIGYTCWAFVVSAGDIGANHERARSWIIGCDLARVADDDGFGRHDGWQGRRSGLDLSIPQDTGHASQDGCGSRVSRRRAGTIAGAEQSPCGDATPHAYGDQIRLPELPRGSEQEAPVAGDASETNGSAAHADQEGQEGQEGQEDGSLVPSLRQAEITDDGRGSGRGDDRTRVGQMGLCPGDSDDAVECRADWSLDDLAHHLRVDAGLSAWVAQSRIAVGSQRGTSAASLIVEAYGDAVVPQIPEAIGRAILRTEAALSSVYAA